MSASAVKSPRFPLAEDGAGNSKPNEMSEHYRAINLDSNRSAESAGALLWVTEHPNTLLLDIYFPERSRGSSPPRRWPRTSMHHFSHT